MENRGDMTCLHEPYNEVYYLGEDRRNDRYFIAEPDLQTKPGLNFASTHAKLQQLAARHKVFIKDFAYSVMHVADDAFLDAFQHTFLIRDPEKVVTSMHARWPDAALDEIGFEDLHTLHQRVADRDGMAPVVIDSDDLLSNPERGMKAYCEATGLPFIPNSTQWKNSQVQMKRGSPTWSKHAYGFHHALRASDGLAHQQRDYPPIDTNEGVQRLYAACLPHYQALAKERLQF